jgi:hypothetical protein
MFTAEQRPGLSSKVQLLLNYAYHAVHIETSRVVHRPNRLSYREVNRTDDRRTIRVHW